MFNIFKNKKTRKSNRLLKKSNTSSNPDLYKEYPSKNVLDEKNPNYENINDFIIHHYGVEEKPSTEKSSNIIRPLKKEEIEELKTKIISEIGNDEKLTKSKVEKIFENKGKKFMMDNLRIVKKDVSSYKGPDDQEMFAHINPKQGTTIKKVEKSKYEGSNSQEYFAPKGGKTSRKKQKKSTKNNRKNKK
jgi:hypothetical protein